MTQAEAGYGGLPWEALAVPLLTLAPSPPGPVLRTLHSPTHQNCLLWFLEPHWPDERIQVMCNEQRRVLCLVL